jgi:uncharacterized protein (TIGR03790 family)
MLMSASRTLRRISLKQVLAAAIVAGLPALAAAIDPADVYLLVNERMPASRDVAEHYCTRRSVPREHIIALDLPTGEDMTRAQYEKSLLQPLRKALQNRRDKTTVLISTYGIPLRVGGDSPTAEERAEIAKLQPRLTEVQRQHKQAQDAAATMEKHFQAFVPAYVTLVLRQQRETLARQLQRLEERRRHLQHDESQASVDSELMLLWWETYELRRWQVNLGYFQVPEKVRASKPPIVLVSRLDGPTPAVAKRLVDDAVATEEKGLTGKVYVDARGIGYDPKKDPGYGYGGYDESLREMASLLHSAAGLAVTLDNKGELFAPGSCPDCALYCGWYSLANYVPCCRFVRGAVAYHIASSEAVSLRDPNSKQWCKCLLDDGVAATLGPVAEPYTIGFPKPAEFFGFLVTGKYTLVECYAKTVLLNSWMTVLVGDPLYNPYAKASKLKIEQVKPSPAGGRFTLLRGP